MKRNTAIEVSIEITIENITNFIFDNVNSMYRTFYLKNKSRNKWESTVEKTGLLITFIPFNFSLTMYTSTGHKLHYNTVEIIILFICPVTLLFHFLGTFVVSCLIHNGGYKIRHLLLLNYSLCVIATGSTNIIHIMVHRYLHDNKGHACCVMVYYVFFCAMIFINLDRLLEVLLNIKYPVYITKNRTVGAIAFSWCVGIVASVMASVLTTFEEMLDYLPYIATPIDICYLVFVTVSWTIIFYHFKRSRRHPTALNNSSTVISIGATFRKSKFFVALLLVLSFVLCTIPPDLMVMMKSGQDTACLSIISFYIASTVDALLYITMDRLTRRMLWRKLRINRRGRISPRWGATIGTAAVWKIWCRYLHS